MQQQKKQKVDRCWRIAAGCCFINMMLFGMARLSGVLFVASVPAFRVSRERASLPYTLSQATRNTAGPVVGYLGQKFGVRAVTSWGCLIAAAGIGACYLAPDIDTVTVLWGIVFGVGFGMGNILLPISINQYFDKKRATASGLSFSGACIGSFAIPPVVELLISNYGLSGTFLFLSGFVLNCVPAALLLRKPRFALETRKASEKQRITDGKKVKLYTVEDPPPHSATRLERNSFNEKPFETNSTRPARSLWKENEHESKAIAGEAFSNPFSSKDHNECRYPKSYTNLAFQENFHPEFSDSRSVVSSVPTVQEEKASSDWRAFSVIFDPMFVWIALTNALYSAMFVCMITVVVDFARDLGVGESNEKFVLMSLSVGDLVGRLGLGWVTDGGHLSRSQFAALCFLCQAIATVLVAFSTGLAMLLLMAALYGLSEAGLILIFPLLVAEYMEEDKQTVAIPSSYFLSGPLCLTVAPLIGFFRDQIGSYELLFYGIGVLSALCSAGWIVAPALAAPPPPSQPLKCLKRMFSFRHS